MEVHIMADRLSSNRRPSGSRQDPPRRSRDRDRQDAPDNRERRDRREQMIHCDRCGEDYSATYKRCPFCDERANGGKRQSNRRGGGYGAPVNPTQIAAVVIGLVIIIAALYIVFAKIGPFFFGDKDKPDPSGSGSGSSTSQVDPGSSQQPSGSGDVSTDPVTPQPPAVPVTSLTLDRTDFTLNPDEHVTLTATVVPQDAGKVTWSSDHPDVLNVSDSGTVINVNTGSSKVKVTVTASIGDKKATCTVYCKPGSKGGAVTPPPAQPDNPTPTPDPQPPAGGVKPGTEAVITGAGTGLKVRSGPGTDHEVIASIQNGSTVIVKEDAGKGWYKVDYGNGKLGYVSSSFVKAK